MKKYRYDLYAFLLLGLFYFSEGITKKKNQELQAKDYNKNKTLFYFSYIQVFESLCNEEKRKNKTNEKRGKFKSKMCCVVVIGKANKIERNKILTRKKGKVKEMCASELRKI